MLGRYRVAVEDNTDSFWKQEENEMLMKILIVSSSSSIIRVILTSVQENDPVDVPPPSPLRFPVMQDWLAMEDDRKSDRAVWGEEKGSYSFEDLKDYIQKKKREREIAERAAALQASGSHAESRESSDRKGKKKSKKSKRDSSE